MSKRWIKIDPDGVIERVAYADGVSILERAHGGTWVEFGALDDGANVQEGGVYDSELGVCKTPQPFPSWIWDVDANTWVAPVAPPNNDGVGYSWNETTQEWVAF